MSTNSQQYANLASDAYSPYEPGRRARGLEEKVRIDEVTYKVIEHVDRPSGYQGTIYQRLDTGAIVVAHRGTEFGREFVKDGLLADGGMIAARVNRQADDAIGLTRRAVEYAQGLKHELGRDVPVSVTGHSLGGCLAQISAYRFGLGGETFNPYGAASLRDRIPEGGIQVLNHVMAGDMVSAAGRHFGRVRMYAVEQEVDTLTRVGRYADNGDRLDIRYALPAAAAGWESHRMHHFLPVDGAGRRDRSVLDDPQAQRLAQQHRPMFDKYRSDMLLTREGASIAAALAQGARGVAGELLRHLPDRPQNPFDETARRLPPMPAAASSDPRLAEHPDHRLYGQVRAGVAAIHQGQGLGYGEDGERTAASLLVLAKRSGLSRVDQVVAGHAPGQPEQLFVVQGDPRDPAHIRAQMAAADAAKTPVAESLRALAALNTQAPAPVLASDAQDRTRPAPMRSH